MHIFASLIITIGSITLSFGSNSITFKSNVRHSMSKYEAPKTKTPLILQLSAWELNLVNEALVGILVSKCSSIDPDEADDLKTYISEQVESAPTQSSMNPKFLDTYGNLIKCLDLTELHQRNRSQIVDMQQDLSKTSYPSESFSKNPINEKNGDEPIVVKSVSGVENHNQQQSSDVEEYEKPRSEFKPRQEVNAPEPTEALSNQNSMKDKQSKVLTPDEKLEVLTALDVTSKPTITTTTVKPPLESGILNTVGHLFSKLYENTVNVISWFGRKKRQTELEDKKNLFNLKRRVTQGIEKESRNRISKKHHRLSKSKSHRRFNKGSSSVMGAKIHFNEMFDSIRFIARYSCPAQIDPVIGFVNEAIKEILWYVYEDLKDVEAEGQKLSIDLALLKRVKKCVKVKEFYVQ